MNQLEEFFKILNMHQTDSKNEIIAKLDEFIAGQERLEAAINKLGDDNSSKLEYIANLIKNKTTDNADVIAAIQALAESNEESIAAATEALAAKLDKLIAKIDAILNKMDNLASVLKQYGDQVLAKLDVNDEILKEIKKNGDLLRDANGKLDLTNLSLAQLQAEVEKIAPQLQKLINNTNTSNGYLDIISKKQIEIDQHILDLQNIGGGGITADELEALWIKHDADAFAKFKAYMDGIHADNMDKADEIIGYLKKGNATAADTYQLLIDFKNKAGNDAEALKKLLQAVYDYLPELICKCNCSGNCGNNDNVNEGIIDIIS
jgi:chromosome segregation ATPase